MGKLTVDGRFQWLGEITRGLSMVFIMDTTDFGSQWLITGEILHGAVSAFTMDTHS